MTRRIPDELRAKVAELEARKPLSRAQVIAILCRQAGGIECGCGCGEPLDALVEGCVDEHRVALGLTGTNDLPNRELWRKPCSVAKTKADFKAIAKCKRITGETGNGAKRAIPQRAEPWGPKGVRKIQSRKGFAR